MAFVNAGCAAGDALCICGRRASCARRWRRSSALRIANCTRLVPFAFVWSVLYTSSAPSPAVASREIDQPNGVFKRLQRALTSTKSTASPRKSTTKTKKKSKKQLAVAVAAEQYAAVSGKPLASGNASGESRVSLYVLNDAKAENRSANFKVQLEGPAMCPRGDGFARAPESALHPPESGGECSLVGIDNAPELKRHESSSSSSSSDPEFRFDERPLYGKRDKKDGPFPGANFALGDDTAHIIAHELNLGKKAKAHPTDEEGMQESDVSDGSKAQANAVARLRQWVARDDEKFPRPDYIAKDFTWRQFPWPPNFETTEGWNLQRMLPHKSMTDPDAIAYDENCWFPLLAASKLTGITIRGIVGVPPNRIINLSGAGMQYPPVLRGGDHTLFVYCDGRRERLLIWTKIWESGKRAVKGEVGYKKALAKKKRQKEVRDLVLVEKKKHFKTLRHPELRDKTAPYDEPRHRAVLLPSDKGEAPRVPDSGYSEGMLSKREQRLAEQVKLTPMPIAGTWKPPPKFDEAKYKKQFKTETHAARSRAATQTAKNRKRGTQSSKVRNRKKKESKIPKGKAKKKKDSKVPKKKIPKGSKVASPESPNDSVPTLSDRTPDLPDRTVAPASAPASSRSLSRSGSKRSNSKGPKESKSNSRSRSGSGSRSRSRSGSRSKSRSRSKSDSRSKSPGDAEQAHVSDTASSETSGEELLDVFLDDDDSQIQEVHEKKEDNTNTNTASDTGSKGSKSGSNSGTGSKRSRSASRSRSGSLSRSKSGSRSKSNSRSYSSSSRTHSKTTPPKPPSIDPRFKLTFKDAEALRHTEGDIPFQVKKPVIVEKAWEEERARYNKKIDEVYGADDWRRFTKQDELIVQAPRDPHGENTAQNHPRGRYVAWKYPFYDPSDFVKRTAELKAKKIGPELVDSSSEEKPLFQRFDVRQLIDKPPTKRPPGFPLENFPARPSELAGDWGRGLAGAAAAVGAQEKHEVHDTPPLSAWLDVTSTAETYHSSSRSSFPITGRYHPSKKLKKPTRILESQFLPTMRHPNGRVLSFPFGCSVDWPHVFGTFGFFTDDGNSAGKIKLMMSMAEAQSKWAQMVDRIEWYWRGRLVGNLIVFDKDMWRWCV